MTAQTKTAGKTAKYMEWKLTSIKCPRCNRYFPIHGLPNCGFGDCKYVLSLSEQKERWNELKGIKYIIKEVKQ